jgi:hypothetical protein
MKPSDEGSILHLPLLSTGISETFVKAAELNGYHTLAEILTIPLTDLIKMEWITQAIWEELTAIIEKLSPIDALICFFVDFLTRSYFSVTSKNRGI